MTFKFGVSTIGLILALMIGIPAKGQTAEIEISDCKDKWCFLVAQPPSEWPGHSGGNVFPLEETPGITLNIPLGFQKIYRSGNLLIFSYNQNKATIAFEEISRKTTPELSESSNDNCMSIKDIGHAIFTKTVKDKHPMCSNSSKLWQWAMWSKSVYFREGIPVVAANKSAIAVYYYTSKDKYNPFLISNFAVVINEKRPEAFLVVRTVGFSFDELKNIIGSINETKRGE